MADGHFEEIVAEYGDMVIEGVRLGDGWKMASSIICPREKDHQGDWVNSIRKELEPHSPLDGKAVILHFRVGDDLTVKEIQSVSVLLERVAIFRRIISVDEKLKQERGVEAAIYFIEKIQ